MIDVSDPIKLIGYANSEFEKGNFQNVIIALEEGILKYDEFPLFFLLLAKAYFEIKDFANSKKILDIGLEKFPFNKNLVQFKNDTEKFLLSKTNKKEVNNIFFYFHLSSCELFKKRTSFTIF